MFTKYIFLAISFGEKFCNCMLLFYIFCYLLNFAKNIYKKIMQRIEKNLMCLERDGIVSYLSVLSRFQQRMKLQPKGNLPIYGC